METTSTRYIEKSLMKKEKSSKAPFGGFADRCMICKIFKFYFKKVSLHIKNDGKRVLRVGTVFVYASVLPILFHTNIGKLWYCFRGGGGLGQAKPRLSLEKGDV